MASSSSLSNYRITKTLMTLLIINFLYLFLTTSAVTNSNSYSHFSRFSSSSRTKQVFLASVQESMSHALLARSLAFNLTLSQRTAQVHVSDPIHDCLELLDDTLEMLSRISSSDDDEDVHTWLSATLTNQDTCEQSLQEKSNSYNHGIAMDFVARNLSSLLTNSLELFVSKSKPQRLLSEHEQFPMFLTSSEERRLLEASVEELKIDAVVAADGSGTHKTVGEALLACSLANSGGRTVIHLKAGTYKENINIPTKQKNVMLVGDGKGVTVIVGSRSNRGGYTTYKTATVAAMGDGFIARDITFVNSAGPSAEQAVALRVGADKSVVYRCSIEGYQDSLYTHSKRQFYRDTDITGTVDFVFGNSAVVFQSCNFVARKSGQKNFVTAQGRSNPGQNTGISIHNCKITAQSTTYLGRPWKEYSRTVVMQSYLGGSIPPSGWSPWSGGFGLKTLFYGEFGNSRSSESVDMTVKELQQNLKEIMSKASESDRKKLGYAKVVGIACDVCKPEDVEKLSSFAVEELGSINIWINNAGTNKGFRPLLDFTEDDIKQIVSTNLIGSILCTRGAMEVMSRQDNGGHIFNMDGAGSGGSSTPLTAVYGSTKCGLRQFHGSVVKESQKTKVGLHTASPGMVLTELLLSGSSIKNKQMFNIICELPETVARTLVPRMRVVKGSGKSVNYLTPPRILLAIVTSWLRRGRWFDDQGRALYAAEADRLRNWAENRTRLSLTDAMEMYTENTWVSVFSLSVVCAFIIVSSTTPSSFPGT